MERRHRKIKYPTWRYLAARGALFLAVWLCSAYAFAAEVAVFGDSQHYDDIQRAIVARIAARKPAAVFRVGDMVENGLDPVMWARFEDINKPLRTTTGYYPCLGNHELESPLYFLHFPFLHLRQWYSVDCERMHFVVLDSNIRLDRDSEQYRWLADDLKHIPADSLLTVALFHHPFFDVSKRHGDDEKHIKDVLMPLFGQEKVMLVFNGHEHNYQHFEYKGTQFVTTGGGGSMLSNKDKDNPYLKKFAKAFHYCLISPPDKGAVKVSAVGIDGELIDEFTVPVKGDKL